ncbi:MAG TPA: glucose 1-dehydrogenase [Thermomicrobiales bacterium]|jgi:NAD(P)-dependent dehydrogenase (short-subunit alcohol dehydrogenase family)|nr:glucose 1-dehydrogenase [Thermomicrobiales bacterium]
MRLAGKVILVTGAASGMGRVATRMFVEQGAKVIAADIDEAALHAAVGEIGDREAVLPVTGNVASDADVRRVIDEGMARFGALNVIYNNAGIMPGEDTSVIETSEDTWERVLDVNLKSIFLVCKHGIPRLIDAGGGSVINIASFVALMGCTVPQDAYTASKGGVLSLTRSLAVQYGQQGVRANAICPGPIMTPMLETLFPNEEEKMKRLNRIPLGRFGRAEDIVWAGVFLASDESSWMTGSQFVVDGGITVNYF